MGWQRPTVEILPVAITAHANQVDEADGVCATAHLVASPAARTLPADIEERRGHGEG